MLRVAVFGAGGVGGYLGARLADARTADVTLIARGAHADALRQHGLRLRSPMGDSAVRVPATDHPADVGPVDVVIFTVKTTDTDTAARRLGPLIADDTVVVSFQNGVDNERRIAEIVGREHVAGGAAYIFSTIAEPGVVVHTGGPTRFVFGEFDGVRSARLRRLLDACRGAGVDAELSGRIREVLWRKFVLICAVAGMTAATRLPVGEIRDDPATWSMLRRVVEEAAAVATALDVGLAADIVDQTLELISGLEPDSRSSLYHDLARGAPMELEELNGSIVRAGSAHHVAVPMNEAIHALLSPWAAGSRA